MVSTRVLRRSERPGGRPVDATTRTRRCIGSRCGSIRAGQPPVSRLCTALLPVRLGLRSTARGRLYRRSRTRARSAALHLLGEHHEDAAGAADVGELVHVLVSRHAAQGVAAVPRGDCEGLVDVVDRESHPMHADLVRPGGLRLDRVGVDVLEELEATVAVWRLEHRDVGVVAVEADGGVGPLSTDRVTSENGQPEVSEEGDRRFQVADGDADVLQIDAHALHATESGRRVQARELPVPAQPDKELSRSWAASGPACGPHDRGGVPLALGEPSTEHRGHQNIGWSLALVCGNGWRTPQCSTILPFSSRKKSAATVPGSSAEVLIKPWVTTMSPSPTTRLISMFSSGNCPANPVAKPMNASAPSGACGLCWMYCGPKCFSAACSGCLALNASS